jgi:hypothetical protein
MYLSIYLCLTCFGLSLSPSSEAGVQIRQWFKSPGYGISVWGADTIPRPGWCRKNPPVCKAQSLVIQKSATIPHRTPLSPSPYSRTHKNTRVTNTLCFHYHGKTEQTCRDVCIWSFVWGVQRVASEPPRAPGCHTIPTRTHTPLHNSLLQPSQQPLIPHNSHQNPHTTT